jgi:hypothetical protein
MTLKRAVKRNVRKVRHEVLSIIRQYPRIFLPSAPRRWGPSGADWVRPDTDIVIEGFERSGNTFAVIAFSRSQPRPVRIAHHFHAAAQVIQAARIGIPALVLLRHPEDAILSFLVHYPGLSASQGARTYLRFYAPILPYKDSFVLAKFDTVTANFGSVIECVNKRYGTQFAQFEHTEENVRQSFELIEEMNRVKVGMRSPLEASVARPSFEREQMKAAIRARFHDSVPTRLRSKVYAIYDVCASLADV